MLAAIARRNTQGGPFQLCDRSKLRSADEPKKCPVARHRQHFNRHTALAGARSQSNRAQSIDLARRDRRRRYVGGDLNKLRLESLLAKEAAMLGDVKINERDASARHGDLNLLHLRPCALAG